MDEFITLAFPTDQSIANDSSDCRLNHSKIILFFLLKIKLVFY